MKKENGRNEAAEAEENHEMLQILEIAWIINSWILAPKTGLKREHLQITNHPERDDVTWERTESGHAIHLCAESGANWCQVIFQTGYAMMHCLIDRVNPDESRRINWAEELICEASAIEILMEFEENWEKTLLYRRDPDYAPNITDYVIELLRDRGTSALLRCRDRAALSDLNEHGTFDDRLDESHDLVFRMGHANLFDLAHVRNYAMDNLLLDTHGWLRENPCAPVDYLCRLQENIPGCDVSREDRRERREMP